MTLTIAGIAFGAIVVCALVVIVGMIAFQRGYKKGKRDR